MDDPLGWIGVVDKIGVVFMSLLSAYLFSVEKIVSGQAHAALREELKEERQLTRELHQTLIRGVSVTSRAVSTAETAVRTIPPPPPPEANPIVAIPQAEWERMMNRLDQIDQRGGR